MLKEFLQRSVTVRRLSSKLRRLDLERDLWFEDHYPEWRLKRINAIVDHYGAAFFEGKSVLEVGCGFGDVGSAFADLGAAVTCSDARSQYLDEAVRRHPKLTVVRSDLDRPWLFTERFDVLLHLGVLYHLADPEKAVRDALGNADHVVLETIVSDGNDPFQSLSTVEVGYDQAVNNRGCRPTDAFVERLIVEAGRSFERIKDDRCNSGYHWYDWQVNSGAHSAGLRRMWFIGPRSGA